MSKYEPLQKHLERVPGSRLPMRFNEIEGILGFILPPSSRRHRAWWSNNPTNNVMTHAWLNAGFQTEAVDLEQGRLIFRRKRDRFVGDATHGPSGDRKEGRHPILGCMKGTVKVAHGVDLTAPADPDWGRLAYGDEP